MPDPFLALRGLEGLDLLDTVVIVVDSFKAVGWFAMAIMVARLGTLVVVAAQANPAIGVFLLLVILGTSPRWSTARAVREANFLASCGVLLIVVGWGLAVGSPSGLAAPILGLALAACGVSLAREALVERYQARHGNQPPSLFHSAPK